MKSTITPGAFGNSYLQQFQIAQLNLAKLLEEEPLLKRIKRNKKKITGHD